MTRDGTKLQVDRLLDHLDSLGLSHYDMPEYMLFLDQLPLTANGKVAKRELVKWVEEGRHTPVPVRHQRRLPVGT